MVRPWLRPGRRDARVRGLRAARVHAHTGRHRDASCDGCGSAREGRGLVWQPLGSARHFSIWVLGFSENLRRIMRFSFSAYSISPAPICKLRHHGASFPQSIPIFATRDCGPQHCKRPDQRRFWRRWILQPLFHMPSKFELLKRAGYRPIKQCKEVHGLPCTQPIGHCLFVLLFWGVGLGVLGCWFWGRVLCLVCGVLLFWGCWFGGFGSDVFELSTLRGSLSKGIRKRTHSACVLGNLAYQRLEISSPLPPLACAREFTQKRSRLREQPRPMDEFSRAPRIHPRARSLQRLDPV